MADKETEQSKIAQETKQEQAVVAFHYDSSENPNNAFYPGVPPGDILQEKYDELPKWIQTSIAGNPMYKTPTKKAPDKAKESEK